MGRELGVLLHKVLRAIPGAFILILWGQGNQALHAPGGARPGDLLAPALGMVALAALGAWIGRARSGDATASRKLVAGRLLLATIAGLLAFVLGATLEAVGPPHPAGGLPSALGRGLWHGFAWFALIVGIIGRSERPAPGPPPG